MRVTIEKLAPTGEGITRTSDGVGFVAGALPGEEVEVEIRELKKNFWRGEALEIHQRSPQRVSGPHASCAGCDWADFDPAAALEAKRSLFLETMERIGGQPPEAFGPLPAQGSPARYRLRSRFHVSGTGSHAVLGYFAPRSHRVEPLTDCEALSSETVELLPHIREAIASSGARVVEVSLVETPDSQQRLGRFLLEGSSAAAPRLASELTSILDGVRVVEGEHLRRQEGETRLMVEVCGRMFPLSVDTFFQANKYLVGPLYEHVRDLAREIPAGRALDAFGGNGLFAGALLDAGHQVTTVDAGRSAIRDAQAARSVWADGPGWNIVASPVSSFAVRDSTEFDLAVVDPPRAGLGRELAALLAQRIARRIVYVSCEPATLARDLAPILARNYGILSARLYDQFAGTHRVEAIVTLERKGAA
ncbi:MAG TPA: TRAM domain-containing protein [Thermoanaerobaculia bacterium]|nr:TRAM domain-containing protein [Thermoanaerobaculia bacterium]